MMLIEFIDIVLQLHLSNAENRRSSSSRQTDRRRDVLTRVFGFLNAAPSLYRFRMHWRVT